jgi:metal-responsive CopG/Arc/MetJ family transcriptional regulator
MVKAKKFRQVGVSLPESLLERIDKDRGKIPRSVWIVDLLQKALEQGTQKK